MRRLICWKQLKLRQLVIEVTGHSDRVSAFLSYVKIHRRQQIGVFDLFAFLPSPPRRGTAFQQTVLFPCGTEIPDSRSAGVQPLGREGRLSTQSWAGAAKLERRLLSTVAFLVFQPEGNCPSIGNADSRPICILRWILVVLVCSVFIISSFS